MLRFFAFVQILAKLSKRQISRWRASVFLCICRSGELRWIRWWVVLVIGGKVSSRIPRASIQALYMSLHTLLIILVLHFKKRNAWHLTAFKFANVHHLNAMQDENGWYIVTQYHLQIFLIHALITGDVVRARTSVVAHMWRTEKDKRLMAMSDRLTSGSNAEK